MESDKSLEFLYEFHGRTKYNLRKHYDVLKRWYLDDFKGTEANEWQASLNRRDDASFIRKTQTKIDQVEKILRNAAVNQKNIDYKTVSKYVDMHLMLVFHPSTEENLQSNHLALVKKLGQALKFIKELTAPTTVVEIKLLNVALMSYIRLKLDATELSDEPLNTFSNLILENLDKIRLIFKEEKENKLKLKPCYEWMNLSDREVAIIHTAQGLYDMLYCFSLHVYGTHDLFDLNNLIESVIIILKITLRNTHDLQKFAMSALCWAHEIAVLTTRVQAYPQAGYVLTMAEKLFNQLENLVDNKISDDFKISAKAEFKAARIRLNVQWMAQFVAEKFTGTAEKAWNQDLIKADNVKVSSQQILREVRTQPLQSTKDFNKLFAETEKIFEEYEAVKVYSSDEVSWNVNMERARKMSEFLKATKKSYLKAKLGTTLKVEPGKTSSESEENAKFKIFAQHNALKKWFFGQWNEFFAAKCKNCISKDNKIESFERKLQKGIRDLDRELTKTLENPANFDNEATKKIVNLELLLAFCSVNVEVQCWNDEKKIENLRKEKKLIDQTPITIIKLQLLGVTVMSLIRMIQAIPKPCENLLEWSKLLLNKFHELWSIFDKTFEKSKSQEREWMKLLDENVQFERSQQRLRDMIFTFFQREYAGDSTNFDLKKFIESFLSFVKYSEKSEKPAVVTIFSWAEEIATLCTQRHAYAQAEYVLALAAKAFDQLEIPTRQRTLAQAGIKAARIRVNIQRMKQSLAENFSGAAERTWCEGLIVTDDPEILKEIRWQPVENVSDFNKVFAETERIYEECKTLVGRNDAGQEGQ